MKTNKQVQQCSSASSSNHIYVLKYF